MKKQVLPSKLDILIDFEKIPDSIFTTNISRVLFKSNESVEIDPAEYNGAMNLLKKHKVDLGHLESLLAITNFFSRSIFGVRSRRMNLSVLLKEEMEQSALFKLKTFLDEMQEITTEQESFQKKLFDWSLEFKFGPRRDQAIKLTDRATIYSLFLEGLSSFQKFDSTYVSNDKYLTQLRDNTSMEHEYEQANRCLSACKTYLDHWKVLTKGSIRYPKKQIEFIADWFIGFNLLQKPVDESELCNSLKKRIDRYRKKQGHGKT